MKVDSIGSQTPAGLNVGDAATQSARLQQQISKEISSTGQPSAVDAAQPVKKPVDQRSLKDATDKLNKFVQGYASELNFSVDDDTGIGLVKVIDTQSKEVIRQIPSEEVVALAQSIEKLQGLLLRQKA
jgi:flagellar protein FlaG